MAEKSITESKINRNNLARRVPIIRSKIRTIESENLEKQQATTSAPAVTQENSATKDKPSNLRNLAGRATNYIPYVKQAKVAIKVVKKFSRFFLFISIMPWICLCCYIIFAMFVVKNSLDNPFATVINIIEVGGCAIGGNDAGQCIMKQFYDETTTYLTDSTSEI